MRGRSDEFERAGLGRAAVGLGDLPAARAFRDEEGVDFPLLVDEARTAYRAAGLRRASLLDLFRPGNFRARKRAKGAGFRQKGVGRHPFQLGGSFVFGPGGAVLFAHTSRTFGDAAPVEVLLEAVRGR